MYALWESEEAARGAVAERRRRRANRRTIAATVAALTLGWMLNAASVVVSLPVEAQSTALRNYVSLGAVIGAVVAVAVFLTMLGRSVEARFIRFLSRYVDAGASRRYEAATWFLASALISSLLGTSAAFLVEPLGVSRLQAGLVVGLQLMIILVTARYLIPAEKRLGVRTQAIRESRQADDLAALSEGEQRILERLEVLDATIAESKAIGRPPAPMLANPTFDSWIDWWRARPRASGGR